jgi:hypothetical protein
VRRQQRADGEGEAPDEAPAEFEDVETRAARLGVTVERVLQEYAWIAFADLRHIVDWDAEGLHFKGHLSKRDAAPIAEITGGTEGKPGRVKLYDKKAALDAIARHLGMFTPGQRQQAEADWVAEAENARDELAEWLARLAIPDDPG